MQTELLTPRIINRLNTLDLQARQVVEGFISGLHKSPFHGFSVEFSQHRPYLPGDSLRYVDWKVYGRTDRYYIKQFEQETNLRAHILLDVSASMSFSGVDVSKRQYANVLAAALSFLLIRQKDAVGLIMFDHAIRSMLPARSVKSHLQQIFTELDKTKNGTDTTISAVLHEVAERIHRRGLIIIISDLLDDPSEVLKGLQHFRYDQHEVLVFHILDPAEMNLDFTGDIVFKDLESNETLKTQPEFIRRAYQEKLNTFLETYRTQCSNSGIDYHPVVTSSPYDLALTEFLLKRKRLL